MILHYFNHLQVGQQLGAVFFGTLILLGFFCFVIDGVRGVIHIIRSFNYWKYSDEFEDRDDQFAEIHFAENMISRMTFKNIVS